jgi:hypothetical protein
MDTKDPRINNIKRTKQTGGYGGPKAFQMGCSIKDIMIHGISVITNGSLMSKTKMIPGMKRSSGKLLENEKVSPLRGWTYVRESMRVLVSNFPRIDGDKLTSERAGG